MAHDDTAPGLGLAWPLADRHDVRRALEHAYGAADRGYHDRRHLAEVLERLDELAPHHPFDRTAVHLAAWFHDAVYDGAPDPEERSARWAADALAGAPVDVDEVVRLVRLTERHDPGPGDDNGAALCDADLAILAADPARYRQYTEGVRREYAHVPDREFALGRATVLGALTAGERVFRTAYARAHWEPAARENVGRELAVLREVAGGAGAGAGAGAGDRPDA